MCNTTVSNKRQFNCKQFFEQPMSMLESKLNVIIYNNLHLKKALDGSVTLSLV